MIRLRMVRNERGITQVKLSGMTGISPSDIAAVENGNKPAFPGWRRRIAAALDEKNPDRLFEEVDEGEVADQRSGSGAAAGNPA